MAERKPTLCIIAGPNGSGKTTTTEQLLSNEWGADSLYINPDNIAQEEYHRGADSQAIQGRDARVGTDVGEVNKNKQFRTMSQQEYPNKLTSFLLDECSAKRKGGLYHKTQVKLAYNSNRIEGSKLTEEQTRYIFETRTIGFKDQEAVPVDDIIETTNHFVAFDYLLRTIHEPLSEEVIKDVGDYKQLANEVGGRETCQPADVAREMQALNQWYNSLADVSIHTLAEYHWRFESIHPFQDGNGRVGRLILFRECLRHSVMPFVIDNEHKMYYYRGLSEFKHTPGFLVGTMQSAQDVYEAWIKYFNPDLLEGLKME